LWAKTAKDGALHPLWAHLLDVAAAAEVILEFEPASTLALIAEDLQLPLEEARRWTIALAGLHDIGKATPSFQRKSKVGRDCVEQYGLSCKDGNSRVPHGHAGDQILAEFLQEAGWQQETACLAADAVGAHHGRRRGEVTSFRLKELGQPEWSSVQRELVHFVLETVGAGKPPQLSELGGAGFHRMAGLASFADWIGSSLDWQDPILDREAYFANARRAARVAIQAIGWPDRRLRDGSVGEVDEVFSYLGTEEEPFKARELQSVVAELVRTGAGPALLLIEAPMGEGKSEAALYAHLVLNQVNDHRGLYVALPTQATSNSMYTRLVDFLASRGHPKPPDLQLLHGGKELNEEYRELRVRPNDPRDAVDLGRGVVAAQWFTKRKRGLLSEHAVGTVDQALLGILPVPHHFVRLWGLANRTVVLDEVHAYGTYTTELIVCMIRWLRALGSSVIVMSATLPRAARAEIVEAFGGSPVPETSYPRVTMVRGGEAVPRGFHADPTRSVAVEVQPAALAVPELAEEALSLVKDGGSVACILNTVDRAQSLYLALKGRLPEDSILELFHARFPAEQRQQIELRVLERFGKDRPSYGLPGAPKRAVLVSTQVAEQSLDIDVDAMITDLAPVDLVLQRAGRMHRHRRKRPPGQERARLLIAGMHPAANGLPDLSSAYFERIYERYVLLRSWVELSRLRELRLPLDIDPLVQRTYTPVEPNGIAPSIAAALESARGEMQAKRFRDRSDAVHANIGVPDGRDWWVPRLLPWDDVDAAEAAATGRAAQTRKGTPSLTVVPVFGEGEKQYLDAKGPCPAPQGVIGDDEARLLWSRAVRISRHDLVRALSGARPPTGWDRHPLTRGLRKLPLGRGTATAVIGRTTVELNEELGLVYRGLD
jgi:CRISPR-associated endonuclease/helicase Cas3